MPFPRSILRCLRPAFLAEWALDTLSAMVDCPPGLWKMSRADRAFAARMVARGVRKPIVSVALALTARRGFPVISRA